MENPEYTGLEIAVIGMSCEFKNCDTYHAFWKQIKNGHECIGYYSDQELIEKGVERDLIDNPNFVKINPHLERRDYFDYPFFGIHLPDAKIVSHQARLLMESVWSTFEDAGYLPQELKGKVGIFCGANSSLDDEIHAILSQYSHLSPMETSLLADKNYIATRLAYYYNFTGPAICVDTACSTSLVAIHLACQALLSGDCDMAIAGGATILPDDTHGYLYQEGMIYSKDGHTRSFDGAATGTINSEGVGTVLLKTLDRALKDKDHIHGVIRSTAVNNDGRRKIGYTAPSVKAQTDLIKFARQAAEVPAESICYIEAHGSGTIVGDPIEFQAIVDAFEYRFNPHCRIGSVKSNLGHAIHAAGIAGIVKVMKILQEKVIPPNLNYLHPNPLLDFTRHALKVNTELFPIPQGKVPLRACLNSLGIGGTNAHAICEEAPKRAGGQNSRSHYLLCLSAKTESANRKQTENLSSFLNENPFVDLCSAAFTLTQGRTQFPYRSYLVVDAKASGVEPQKFIKAVALNRPLAFIFPGLGLDFHPLAKDLYENERVFREYVDSTALFIKDLLSLDVTLYFTDKEAFERAACKLSSFEVDQLITFVFCYSYASLFIHWNIQPSIMLGYSFGELVAAVLAGVMSVQDALILISKRGSLISKTEKGAMLSVPVTKEALLPLIQGMQLSIAIDNGASLVLAGSENEIAKFEEVAKHSKLLTMRLKAEYGIHSHLMDPIKDEFAKIFDTITLQSPKKPLISCVTGTLTDQNVTSATYWIQHLSRSMCFAEGVQTLSKGEYNYVIIGPQHEYSSLVKRFLPKSHHSKIISCGQSNQYSDAPLKSFYQQVGHIWATGSAITWSNFYENSLGLRIPLPTYPFDRLKVAHSKSVIQLMKEFVQGYTQIVQEDHPQVVPALTNEDFSEVSRERMSTLYTAPRIEVERILSAMWENFLGIRTIGIYDHFLELGGDSLKAITILGKVREQFGMAIPLAEFFKEPTVAFLAQRISQKTPASYSRVAKSKVDRIIPITPSQELFWRAQKLFGYEYSNAQILKISGIDEDKMQRAIQLCVHNNPIFRLKIAEKDGKPALEYSDELYSPIQLKQENGRYLFSISLPAMLSDGFSINLLLGQIVESYVTGDAPKLHISFPDYLVWRNQHTDTYKSEEAKEYWNLKVSSINATEYAKSSSFTPRTMALDSSIDEAVQIYQYAQSRKMSANTLFTALFSFCLSRFANDESIAIGYVMDDRDHPDTSQMIGMFRKVLPVVISCDKHEDFNQHVQRVHELLMEAMTHKNYDYELDLIDTETPFPSYHPVIQFHETMDEKNGNESGIEIHEVIMNHYSMPFAIKCDVFRLKDGLQFCFSYNAALLNESKVDAIVSEFKNIIKEDILLQSIVTVQ